MRLIGSTTPEDYTGGRTAETIVDWVNDKIGTRRVVKTAPSNVVALTQVSQVACIARNAHTQSLTHVQSLIFILTS